MTREILSALLTGILFGLGLAIAQMTDPNKVLNFLDITGQWDPSLAFVMASALLVVAPAYRFILRRKRPLWGATFQVPTRSDIDSRLVVGSALFGIGWGLSGYCPGPAITALATLSPGAVGVVGGLLIGMWAHDMTLGRRAS